MQLKRSPVAPVGGVKGASVALFLVRHAIDVEKSRASRLTPKVAKCR